MNPFRRNTGRAARTVVTASLLLATAACGGATSTSERNDAAATPPPAVAAAMDRVLANGFPGVEVTIDGPGGQRVYRRGLGDIAAATPFPAGSHLRIGSNTKTFVATVILQLVAEGRIELDAPMERYLPGVVHGNGNDGNRITVRQLLQHTSGLPDYLGRGSADGVQREHQQQLNPELLSSQSRSFTPAELAGIAMTMPPAFEPGARSVYTNTNYVLLGMLIEQVTGRPAAAEISRRLIEPLGLRETYSPAAETTVRAPHPRGYHTADGKQVDFTDFDTSWASTAGDMISTGAELNTFFIALLSGKLLPAAQLAEMQRTVPFDRMPGASYGLGLIRKRTSCGEQTWGHGGSIPGFETRNSVAADGTAVTVAVNQLPTSDAGAAAVQALLDVAHCLP